MDGKFTNLTNLSDSDFLNFLYSERDREKSLSEKNGWTNWAIAGAGKGARVRPSRAGGSRPAIIFSV